MAASTPAKLLSIRFLSIADGTFLKICQDIARESGTVAAPLSTVAVTDKWTAKIVAWGRRAWIDIQNAHESWRFLRRICRRFLWVLHLYARLVQRYQNFGAWRTRRLSRRYRYDLRS